HSAARWGDGRGRLWLISFSCVALALAALARQNGAIIVPAAAIALGWIAMRQASMRAGLMYGAALLGAVTVIALAARAALDTRVDSDLGPAAQIELLQTYDVIGALKTDPQFRLAGIESDDPELARVLRTEGVSLYTPERNDPLTTSDTLEAALDDAPD